MTFLCLLFCGKHKEKYQRTAGWQAAAP